MFRLVNEMRARSISRADDLARQFEVSVPTVYRDIAHLQASGLPIEGAAGVGYLLRPGFDLPAMTFTHDQIDALALGLSMAESLDDAVRATAAREARAKLQTSLPDPAARKLAGAPFFALRRSTGAPKSAALLRLAIRKRRCDLRQDFRTFRIDRVVSLTLTDASFNDEPGKTLAAFLERQPCEECAGHKSLKVRALRLKRDEFQSNRNSLPLAKARTRFQGGLGSMKTHPAYIPAAIWRSMAMVPS